VRYVEILCEGSSDVPALREVLQRRFKLTENEHFRIHPHKGKGKLPAKERWLSRSKPLDHSLLGQLPVKLKHMGRQTQGEYEVAVVVVVDADDDDCEKLERVLHELCDTLPTKPPHHLFCIAVEETESWFIAEPQAVKRAYPHAKTADLARHPKDAICGAWEVLARSLGVDPASCSGRDKHNWATAISPHLDLNSPRSPSLAALVSKIEKIMISDHP
jgi:hypothetical protein